MINLLDHGYIRLVDHMGSDLSVIRNARNSYAAEWRTGEDAGKDEKLLHRLMREGHSSPFEAVVFTFDTKAPIFVFRQWHRHRTQSYSEVSARYTELPEEFYIPAIEHITTQHGSNKQMRTEEQHPHAEEIAAIMRVTNEIAFHKYKALLKSGCARELARSILPLATYSRMFTTVNLLNLFRFLKERLHPSAQYEIRIYAEAILELITPIVPVSVAAFKEYMRK